MTLQCQCGGHVEITNAIESERGFTEVYECPECGATGTYNHYDDTRPDETLGCLVNRTGGYGL